MDKKIKLEMKDNRDIVISVDDIEKITIIKDSRKILAEDIFQILEYSDGDSFYVEMVNEKNLDAPVLEFFKELLDDIVNKLGKENDEDCNDEIEMEPYELNDEPQF